MLSNLRKLAWNYNCYVFTIKDNTGFGNAKGFQIYSLDKDNLTNCMKKINYLYDLKWFSNMITCNDIRGFYYYIEL